MRLRRSRLLFFLFKDYWVSKFFYLRIIKTISESKHGCIVETHARDLDRSVESKFCISVHFHACFTHMITLFFVSKKMGEASRVCSRGANGFVVKICK